MNKLSTTPPEALLEAIVKGIDDVKGHDITVVDLKSVTHAISSFFVIAHGGKPHPSRSSCSLC